MKLKGVGTNGGTATGPVRVLSDPHAESSITQGAIIVTEAAIPEMMPSLSKAAAIVTDYASVTSHPALVARELGIPAVVNTVEATNILAERQIVTVDGDEGVVVVDDD